MDQYRDTPGQQRGHVFVKAVVTSCMLGAGWLVVVLTYAAWVGVHG